MKDAVDARSQRVRSDSVSPSLADLEVRNQSSGMLSTV